MPLPTKMRPQFSPAFSWNKKFQLYNNQSGGYAILLTVILISTLAVVIFLTLQVSSLSSVQNTTNNIKSQEVFYAAETAIHDALGRIVASSYNWPPDGQTIETITVDGISVIRTTDKDPVTGQITIQTEGNHQNISRTLQAGVEQIGIVTDIPLDIILSIDTSASMDDTSASTPCDAGGDPCEPLNAAREASKLLVDEVFDNDDNSTHRIAIYAFDDQAYQVHPLAGKADRDAIKTAIDGLLVTGSGGQGFTNVGDGIHLPKLHHDANLRAEAKQAIIVLTDGSSNYEGNNSIAGYPKLCGPPDPYPPTSSTDCTRNPAPYSATTRAQEAKDAGYEIYSIGLNISYLQPTDHATEAWETLKAVGSTPNHYFDAPDQTDLAAIFSNIAGQLGQVPKFVINAD